MTCSTDLSDTEVCSTARTGLREASPTRILTITINKGSTEAFQKKILTKKKMIETDVRKK